MPALILVIMFCASAPLFLLPTTLALLVNRSRAAWIVICNLVLLAAFYSRVWSFFHDEGRESLQFPVRLGILGMVILWLVLLRFAIKRESPAASV